MPAATTFMAWAESLPTLSYYAILRVDPASTPTQVKAAFHSFALRAHPDRYVDHEPEVARAAAEVFKRGVEAYSILSKPDLRAKYDKGLVNGKLRLDPDALPSVPPPPPREKTIEESAQTPKGKQIAAKADRFITIGRLEDARIQIINATLEEPFNEELKERLAALYQALCSEPL
jgi:curved DNA-binding protein CbpA